MKKVILSLIGLALSASAVMAQTNAEVANNGPTETGLGYAFNFGGTDANNAKGGAGIADFPGITNQSWAVDGKGHLVVSVPDTMTVYNGDAQRAKFYSGNATTETIDLSANVDQKLKISLKSPSAGEMVLIFYSGAASNYNVTTNVFTLVEGQNDFSVTNAADIKFGPGGITDSSSITGIGLVFRTAWGNSSFNGDVVIDYILIGDAVTQVQEPKFEFTTKLGAIFANPTSHPVPNAEAGEIGDRDTLKLRNKGNDSLRIASMVLSGTNASEFEIGTVLTYVNESVIDSTFWVRFTPDASSTVGDTKTALLTVTSDDPTNPTFELTLTAEVGGEVTGTTASVNNSLISVYPNPAKDQINVDLSSLNSSSALVKVMNAKGMLVYEAQVATTNANINTTSFNKGIYFVQVSSGNRVANQKIVIE